SLYDFGPAPQLLRLPVDQLSIQRQRGIRATVEQAPLLANVRPRSQFVPAQVFGSLTGEAPAGHTLAFALNGTVVATAPSFAPLRGTDITWSVMLPPDAFEAGPNNLEVFQVAHGRTVRRLY